MNAQFLGGPYDGIVLSHIDINSHCQLAPITRGSNTQLFVLMPPLKDWERFLNGELRKGDQVEMLYPYERFRQPDGTVEFRFDADGSAFADGFRAE